MKDNIPFNLNRKILLNSDPNIVIGQKLHKLGLFKTLQSLLYD